MSKYTGRMFFVCMLFTLAGIAGFFLGKLAGSEFVTLALGLPAAFGLKDWALAAVHKKGGTSAP